MFSGLTVFTPRWVLQDSSLPFCCMGGSVWPLISPQKHSWGPISSPKPGPWAGGHTGTAFAPCPAASISGKLPMDLGACPRALLPAPCHHPGCVCPAHGPGTKHPAQGLACWLPGLHVEAPAGSSGHAARLGSISEPAVGACLCSGWFWLAASRWPAGVCWQP